MPSPRHCLLAWTALVAAAGAARADRMGPWKDDPPPPPREVVVPPRPVVAPAPAPAVAAPERLCKVSIISAPERIRLEIDQWVAAEHRCSRTLELRIEPGEGGLTVYARDDRGHVRQRLVPDDQSIGALVVSWIADDAPAPPPAPAIVTAPAPAVAAAPPPARPALRLALHEVPLLAPEAELAASVREPKTQAWWMLSGAISVSELRKFGVRAERDLAHHGRWLLDVALSQLENSQDSLAISMTTATAFLAVEGQHGAWQARAQAGVGLRMFWVRNYCDCEQLGVQARSTNYVLRPVTEASALIGHTLGGEWSLALGALLTVGTIGFDVPNQDRASVMMFAGLRNRLE